MNTPSWGSSEESLIKVSYKKASVLLNVRRQLEIRAAVREEKLCWRSCVAHVSAAVLTLGKRYCLHIVHHFYSDMHWTEDTQLDTHTVFIQPLETSYLISLISFNIFKCVWAWREVFTTHPKYIWISVVEALGGPQVNQKQRFPLQHRPHFWKINRQLAFIAHVSDQVMFWYS